MVSAANLKAYNRTRDPRSKSLVCHAPFVTIHFDPVGNAYSCDSSYRHVLGRYPEQSIREIWFGDQTSRIRQWIRDVDLSHSCQRCDDQLNAGNYFCLRAKDYDSAAAEDYPAGAMPRVMEFDLSNLCNLGCVMCNGWSSSWIRHHREHLPPLRSPYDEAFVDQLEEFVPGLEWTNFVGGEPFMTQIYYRIWDRIARVKPKLTLNITTNGTIWNDHVEKTLDRLRCAITVSIDSLQRETYEKIRVNASFPEVMRNLDRLTDYCRKAGTPIRLGFCPMRINWREIPDVVDFCNQRDTELVINNVLHPSEATLRTLSYRDLAEIVEYLEGRGAKAASRMSRINLDRYRSLIHQLVAWREDASSRVPDGGEAPLAARRQGDAPESDGPVRSAMMDWMSGLLSVRGDGSVPASSLSQRLRVALERDGAESFLEQYFQALGDVGPVLHKRAPDITRTAREVGALIARNEHRDWFVEQLIRWDPDHVLTALKSAPPERLGAWVDEQFAYRREG
jgi:radical SAM protein with 4Fe4S-binding SPASM domain